MKKILAMIVSVALVATMAITGSVAYLQSTDEAVNTMTLGNVEIVQHEYERSIKDGEYEKVQVAKADGSTVTSYKVKEYTQAKPLYPAVGVNPEKAEVTGWDSIPVRWEQLDSYEHARGSMSPLAGLNNVQDKFVVVENTGKTDAYVRTIIAYEVGSATNAMSIPSNANTDLIMTSYNGAWSRNGIGTVNIDDNNYYVVEYVYDGSFDGKAGENAFHPDGIVHPGDFTYNSLGQVYMTPHATNEDCEAIDGNDNGTYDILVVSQAVQAAGFADAQTALDTAFGDITTSAHPWVNYDFELPEGEETGEGEDRVKVYDLKNDITKVDESPFVQYQATEPYTINGNGHSITLVATDEQTFDWTENYTIPLMSLVFSSENGAKVTVNDLTIEGTMQSVMAGNYESSNQGRHNTEFNNVNIINPEVVSLSANISPALSIYGTATLNNCNVYGATLSPLDTDPMWPVYDLAVVNFTNTTINDGKIGSIYTWAKAYLEINNAEVDSILSACRKTNDFSNGGLVIGNGTTVDKIEVTNANGVLTVKAGATVNTLDLTKVTNKDGITIEEGATVTKIVVDGTETTFDEWKNA